MCSSRNDHIVGVSGSRANIHRLPNFTGAAAHSSADLCGGRHASWWRIQPTTRPCPPPRRPPAPLQRLRGRWALHGRRRRLQLAEALGCQAASSVAAGARYLAAPASAAAAGAGAGASAGANPCTDAAGACSSLKALAAGYPSGAGTGNLKSGPKLKETDAGSFGFGLVKSEAAA